MSDAFRHELRTWLEAHVPDDLRRGNIGRLPEAERVRRLRAWQAEMAAARWVGITWPSEFGGRDAGIPEQVAYVEEMARVHAPEIIGNLGLGIAGPPIIAYGTEEQKRRSCRASSPATTSGASASPSLAPAPTSRPCARRPFSTATTSCSRARRCGRRSRTTPTGAWSSRAPIRARSARRASRASSST
jgi:hypothetical protein